MCSFVCNSLCSHPAFSSSPNVYLAIAWIDGTANVQGPKRSSNHCSSLMFVTFSLLFALSNLLSLFYFVFFDACSSVFLLYHLVLHLFTWLTIDTLPNRPLSAVQVRKESWIMYPCSCLQCLTIGFSLFLSLSPSFYLFLSLSISFSLFLPPALFPVYILAMSNDVGF